MSSILECSSIYVTVTHIRVIVLNNDSSKFSWADSPAGLLYRNTPYVSCTWFGFYLSTKDPVLGRRVQNLARIWMRQKSRCHFRIHLEMKKSRKMTLSCSLFYPKASEVSIVFSIACWRVLSDYEPQKFSLHRLNGAVSRRWILL
jgi:hypothetical protein